MPNRTMRYVIEKKISGEWSTWDFPKGGLKQATQKLIECQSKFKNKGSEFRIVLETRTPVEPQA